MAKLIAISIFPASIADNIQKVALQFRDFIKKIDPRDKIFPDLIKQFQNFFETLSIELLKFYEKNPESKNAKKLFEKSRQVQKTLFSVGNFYQKANRYQRALTFLRDLKRTILSAGPQDQAVASLYERVETLLAPIENEIYTKTENTERIINELNEASKEIKNELISDQAYKESWVQSRITELRRPEIHKVEFSTPLIRITEEIKANRKTLEEYIRLLKFISVMEGAVEHKVKNPEEWNAALAILPRPDTSPVVNSYVWKSLPIKPGTTLKEMYQLLDESEGRIVIRQKIKNLINSKEEINEAIENLKNQIEELSISETQAKGEVWQGKVQDKYENFLVTIQKYINNVIGVLATRMQVMDIDQIKTYLSDAEKTIKEMAGEAFVV